MESIRTYTNCSLRDFFADLVMERIVRLGQYEINDTIHKLAYNYFLLVWFGSTLVKIGRAGDVLKALLYVEKWNDLATITTWYAVSGGQYALFPDTHSEVAGMMRVTHLKHWWSCHMWQYRRLVFEIP